MRRPIADEDGNKESGVPSACFIEGDRSGWIEARFNPSTIVRREPSENDRHEGASAPSLAFNQNGPRWREPVRKIRQDHGRLLQLVDHRMGAHVDRTLEECALFH